MLDGPHLLTSYLDCGGMPELVAVSEHAEGNREIEALLARAGAVPVLKFSSALFAQIAPVAHPVGILAVARIPASQEAATLGPCVVVLDGLQDPGNVGTIIRTAAAAGASDVVLAGGCADAWSPKTLRAGMGGHFVVSVRTAIDPVAALQGFQGSVVATEARGGATPQSVDLTGRVAFLFGSEGAGLTRFASHRQTVAVTIPMAAGIESLNVAAAAAVLLFERVRQSTA